MVAQMPMQILNFMSPVGIIQVCFASIPHVNESLDANVRKRTVAGVLGDGEWNTCSGLFQTQPVPL